jgi:tetratricopeptide (TPR) repeat protein
MRYGLDLEETSVDHAIERLRSRPTGFVREVVASLDHWLTFSRVSEVDKLATGLDRAPGGFSADRPRGVPEVDKLATGLDPEPERKRLRALVAQPDLAPHRDLLRAIARQSKTIELGPSVMIMLARGLNSAGDRQAAISALRAAVVRYPDDVWINLELARHLRKAEPPQLIDSIRYYTAARGFQPRAGWDLAELLEAQGRDDEAEAVWRELVRLNATSPRFAFRLCALLRRLGRFEEARPIAEKISQYVRENNGFDYTEVANSLEMIGDRDRAILT